MSRLQQLYKKCLDNTAGKDEREEFVRLLSLPVNEAEAMVIFARAFEQEKAMVHFSDVGAEGIIESILFAGGKVKAEPVVHRVHFLRTAWFRAAVAVAVVLIGVFVYDRFLNDAKIGDGRTKSVEALAKVDVLPGSDRAVLVLSDGRKIELGNEGTEIISDGGLNIKNDKGELKYWQAEGATHPATGVGSDYAQGASTRRHPSKGGDWQASYNTMNTPRGGQYKLVLPDGSRVWLNAESSITFPTVFAGKTREIKMTGEAYFEIKTDKAKPFIVKTISDEIQVLGTSFNINAYSDAPVKTSLLEGSVKIRSFILKPGQAFANGKIIATDIGQDIAWQKGYFQFKNADLQTVMRQLSRWYDIEVRYEGAVPSRTFTGKLPRKLSLQQLLRLLKSMDLNFVLNGNVLIIR